MGFYADKENAKNKRHQAAEKRNAAYHQMTVSERLDRLDEWFGAGQGATRERLKLWQQIKFRKDQTFASPEVENHG